MMAEQIVLNFDVFSFWGIAILIIAGFSVGMINTVAGSGSIISYSLFVFLGFPPTVANGTLRVGVVAQTFASTFIFYKNNALDLKKGLLLSIPVILGSIVGAGIAVNIDKDLFSKIVGIIMIIMLFFIFYNPNKWIKEQQAKTSKKPGFIQYLLFFAIGIYGGFIHIGVGIFMLAALVLVSGYDLVKANAIKLLIVFLYSPFALFMFIWHDQVYFSIGIITAIGNLAGGIVASRLAVKCGAGFIRWFLIVVIITFSIKSLFF